MLNRQNSPETPLYTEDVNAVTYSQESPLYTEDVNAVTYSQESPLYISTVQPPSSVRTQIIFTFTGSGGTVKYTVPAGKRTVGSFSNHSSTSTRILINDIQSYIPGSNSASHILKDVVLVAGTVLKNYSNDGDAILFIGVEEDI